MAVDLTLAKAHLRVTGSNEDALITQYIASAKAWVESYIGKKLASGTLTQTQELFGDYIALEFGPVVSLTSIAYTDEDGESATVSAPRLVKDRIYPPEDGWPTADERTPITVTYVAGYSTVPAELDHAVLLLVGEYFHNREAGEASSAISDAVESLCRPYRAVRV